MKCRHCQSELGRPFLDLGFAPPSNAYLTEADLSAPEVTYPLRLRVCESCWLVQTEDYARADEIFKADYAYFSSTSKSWLAHARAYSKMIIERLHLGAGSFVIEVASNDGYLLRNFSEAGIPCLGFEPTEATAAAAEALGIPVERVFFGEEVGRRLAAEGKSADLIAGNNVYAHVPDINDFTGGLAAALKPEGAITLEFPHLLRLMEDCQFDTVYHEHFSYLSLAATTRIFEAAGLRVFDVEEIPTHGGSLRVYGCRTEASFARTSAVDRVLGAERDFGLETLDPYLAFQPRAEAVKDGALAFLLKAKSEDKRVAAYGAAAKGNTLLNFAGVRPDLLPFVSDAATAKQGKYLPGSHIPILPPEAVARARPDYLVVLPWNIAQEIREQFADLAEAGTRFVTFVPELRTS
jgi:C-methyltransferase C-terminal domain/Putative zinc binding domain/Methyltransferase domain